MCEDMKFLEMLKRMINAGGKRVGEADEIELKKFSELRNHFDTVLKSSVKKQLENGKSWSDIGEALGVSRQAAFKKYSD